MVKKKGNKKTALITNSIIGFIVIIALNIFADSFFYRFDLTKEKRYTLSESTKSLLSQLDDELNINVYLDGDLPISYEQLKTATRDMLTEFRIGSKGKVHFTFENVLEDKTWEEQQGILNQFVQKGLDVEKPELDPDQTANKKFIIPAAQVFYKGQEYPLNLLKREFGQSLESEINGSIELLEYEIGTSIRKAIAGRAVKIAFADGHGELTLDETADIANELNEFYKVERISLNLEDSNCYKLFTREVAAQPDKDASVVLVESLIKKLQSYTGLIVAKPTKPFTDLEKVILDQYVMGGGKVIFLVESLVAEMDSVAKYGRVMTVAQNHNLEDLLFNYGVKIQPTLVQDLQCNGIPAINQQSNRPGFWPWWFYPLFNPADDNSITRNLESIWGQYCSTMDTTARQSLKKTILLKTSEQSRVAHNPVMISLDLLKIKPDPRNFNNGGQISAVLVEGLFKSPFMFRESVTKVFDFEYQKSIDSGAMIVIGDGDLIKNQVSADKSKLYPLGYDRFASQHFGEPITFANKKFFLNCVDYLCDESNLIEVRNKEVVLRLLNKDKVKKEKLKWQLINMGIPILLILVFAVVNIFIRKRRWSS